jgi:hypothetical protein
MSNRSLPWGIGIIIAGIIIILGKLGFFHMLGALFWPLLLLAGGIALHMAYYKRMLPSISLLPGGALIVLSVLFLFCTWFGWSWMGFLWPLIPGALAAGLYEYALAEGSQPLRL